MPNSLRVNLNFILQGKLYLSSSSHPIMDPFCQSINNLCMLLLLCLHCLPVSIYIPGLGRSPGEGMQPPPVFLPGESHGQRSLQGRLQPIRSQRGGHDWATNSRGSTPTTCLSPWPHGRQQAAARVRTGSALAPVPSTGTYPTGMSLIQ